jgi:hypothetical protein
MAAVLQTGKNEQQDARWNKESREENSTALGEGQRARDQR